MKEESYQIIFKDVEKAVLAIDELRSMGVKDEDMEIISGLPYSHHILGRPEQKSRIPLYALSGFIFGFVVSLLLNFGTPLLYPIYVGGFPLLSVPPTIILTFEISMLGLMVFTFFGVIWENRFPQLKPLEYSRKISDGYIAVLFRSPKELEMVILDKMELLGGEDVGKAEVLE
jgi:hypothetical protein